MFYGLFIDRNVPDVHLAIKMSLILLEPGYNI